MQASSPALLSLLYACKGNMPAGLCPWEKRDALRFQGFSAQIQQKCPTNEVGITPMQHGTRSIPTAALSSCFPQNAVQPQIQTSGFVWSCCGQGGKENLLPAQGDLHGLSEMLKHMLC